MKLKIRAFELKLAHDWKIARSAVKTVYGTVLIELTSNDGVVGYGESAPSSRYQESTETVTAFLNKVDATKLSFDNIPGSMAYLDTISAKEPAAKTAINIALLDGAAKKAGKAIYDLLQLGFTENKHLTSFTIGIDTPEKVRQKVLEAEKYPILKLKVGGPQDREVMAALRSVAPTKTVRIDGNEGWKTKEEALKNIEWFAQDKHIEFVEQPLPAITDPKEIAWLKERTPLPLYADESYITAKDVSLCADCYHGVNVKLIKTGGITGAYEALQAAKKAGLKRMIGCMLESSVQIAAAAHLAELTNHLDIDGNLLVTNDPFLGPTAEKGMISFATASEKNGLRVKPKAEFSFNC